MSDAGTAAGGQQVATLSQLPQHNDGRKGEQLPPPHTDSCKLDGGLLLLDKRWWCQMVVVSGYVGGGGRGEG